MINLILDDTRDIFQIKIPEKYKFNKTIIVRTISEAIDFLLFNFLESNEDKLFISFDHDLGEGENNNGLYLAKYLYNNGYDIPEYQVHSENPQGAANIISYMESWKKSLK